MIHCKFFIMSCDEDNIHECIHDINNLASQYAHVLRCWIYTKFKGITILNKVNALIDVV